MLFNKASIGKRLLDVLIAALWLYLLLDAYVQGNELPELILDLDLPELPVAPVACVILLITVLCGLITFRQRQNIMEDMPILTSSADLIFGDGAYKYFTLRLRPVCASVLSSLVLAVVGLHATFGTTRDGWSYAISLGFLAFSASMFLAYLLSRRFPPALR